MTAARDRLVQFVPYDADGNVLATNGERLQATETDGVWIGSVKTSGAPARLDVVFAMSQERIEYPFDVRVTE